MRRFNKQITHSDRVTINKQKDVIRVMISKYGFKCPCGRKMNPFQVLNHNHNIYHHCIYCGFDYDYHKILKEVDDRRNNKGGEINVI